MRWISNDPRSGEVTAEVWTFAADSNSTELAYQGQGLQILLDKESIAEGEPAQIMILSDASDRHVLFSVEAERILHIDVLHLTGNLKLVTLPLDKTHVPKRVADRDRDQQRASPCKSPQQLVVPPKKHFLDVTAELDQEAYRPGSDGTFTVTVLDHNGEPVEAEVSLSLYDGSLLAIAKDQIEDPRAFFWGHRRTHRVSQTSTFQHLGYVHWVVDEKGRLMTPEDLQRQKEDASWGQYKGPGDSRRDNGLKSETLSSRSRGAMSKSAGPGSPAPAQALGAAMEMEEPADMDGFADDSIAADPAEAGGESTGDVTVSSDFRETAVWLPTLVTDKNGKATGSFSLPDSTTRWQLSVFWKRPGRPVRPAAGVRSTHGTAPGSASADAPLPGLWRRSPGLGLAHQHHRYGVAGRGFLRSHGAANPRVFRRGKPGARHPHRHSRSRQRRCARGLPGAPHRNGQRQADLHRPSRMTFPMRCCAACP